MIEKCFGLRCYRDAPALSKILILVVFQYMEYYFIFELYLRFTLHRKIGLVQSKHQMKGTKKMNAFRNLYLHSEYSLLSLESESGEGIFVMP